MPHIFQAFLRRRFLRYASIAISAWAVAFGWSNPVLAGEFSKTAPLVEVWKSPTCGCCKDWIEGLKAAGFEVKINDTGNAAARSRFGIPAHLGSCHTARVNGYTLEGHVPVREIRRLLKERPNAVGLAVPGMPRGSPGMEMKDGSRDPYDVLLVEQQGARVYQSYR